MKRLRTFARAMWHALLYRLAGRPLIAPKPVRNGRLQTCYACPHYREHFCQLCQCIVEVKTKLASESCPDGRWMSL